MAEKTNEEVLAAIKPLRPITASRMKQAEQMRVVWHIVPEHGTKFEDVLRPEYWAHIATKLLPGAHIEVAPEDMTFWATLYVIDVTRNAARVVTLLYSELRQEETMPLPLDESQYEVKFKGPHLRWCIIRKSDMSIIRDRMTTREQAGHELADYIRALAA